MTFLDPIAVGDPSATRTVYATTIALVALGLGLAALTWWLFRRTRPEPELFAPLEEMDSRAWRKMSPDERREALEASRPIGARPAVREDDVETESPDDDRVDSPEDTSTDAAADRSDEILDATPAGTSTDVLAEMSAAQVDDEADAPDAPDETVDADDEPTDEHPRHDENEVAEESEPEPALPDGADGTRSSA